MIDISRSLWHRAVVKNRSKLKAHIAALNRIRSLSECCARRAGAVDRFPFEGQRQLPERNRKEREAAEKALAICYLR